MTHGTAYCYRNGCRRPECVEANYAAQQRWRKKQLNKPVPKHVHGTINGYKMYGCRCELCRGAIAGQRRQERAAKKQLRVRIYGV
jgi:hypothetical protein